MLASGILMSSPLARVEPAAACGPGAALSLPQLSQPPQAPDGLADAAPIRAASPRSPHQAGARAAHPATRESARCLSARGPSLNTAYSALASRAAATKALSTTGLM